MRLLILLMLLAAPLAADTNYFPRASPIMPNGMDLDKDFAYGETGDDDGACDATGEDNATSNVAREDVDGDGLPELQIYVNTSTGANDLFCGQFLDPCADPDYALNTRLADAKTVNSGEDNVIVCWQGTWASEITWDSSMDGESGTTTQTAASRSLSNQRYDHEYATDPTIVMGVDTDGDNQYPPFDTGDSNPCLYTYTGRQMNFSPTAGASRIEFAHCTSRGAGTNNAVNGGFWDMASGTRTAGRAEHIYLHDLLLDEVNYQKCHSTGNIAFEWFQWQFQHVVMRRMHLTDAYGYLFRGGMEGDGFLWDQSYVEWRAIGGDNTVVTDQFGNTCDTAISPGATSGGNFPGRIWGIASGDTDVDLVDSTYRVVGYDNGIGSGNNSIDCGIKLSGLREFNFSGNYMESCEGAFPSIDTNDGVGVDQSSQNHYTNHNTYRAVLATNSWATGVIGGVTGVNDQNSTGISTDDNTMTGVFEWNDNCADFSAITNVTIAEGFLLLGSGNADYSAVTWRIERNRLFADWAGSRGTLIWAAPGGSGAIPGELIVNDNGVRHTGTVDTGDDGIDFTSFNYASAWNDSNGGNEIYANVHFNNSTSYTGITAFEAAVGGDGTSTTGVNPTLDACYLLSEGTDVSGSGGGGGGGGGSTVKYFPYSIGSP